MLIKISLLSTMLESKIFLGDVVFPVEVAPSICLFYQGQTPELDVRKNQEYKNISFSMDESSRVHNMYILITLQPSCSAENNNIQHLTVAPSAAYKLYQLQGTRYFNGKGEEILTWDISEKKLDKNIIPWHTLVFVFDPALVEGLQAVSWTKKDSMRLLPKIVIKKTATQDELARAIDIACLSAMDLYSYHKKAGVKTIQMNQAIAKLSNNMRVAAG